MLVSVSVSVQLLTGATSSNSIISPLLGMPSESSGRRGQNGVFKATRSDMFMNGNIFISMNERDGIPKQRSSAGMVIRRTVLRAYQKEHQEKHH